MRPRFALLITLLLAGCTKPVPRSVPRSVPAPAAPTASVAWSAARVITQAVPEVPPPPDPDPTPQLDALRASLQPTAGEGLLLVGLHVDNNQRYYPMFSRDRRSSSRVGSGYRTILLHTKDGVATLSGEEPYLVLPQERGMLFIGESTVGIHEEDDPRDKNANGDVRPHDYDATALWSTRSMAQIPAVAQALEARLRAGKRWGGERIEYLVYVTPRARCRSVTASAWTGGEAWFKGSTDVSFETVSGRAIDVRLAGHVDDLVLRHFAGLAFGIIDDDDPSIDVDKPFMDHGRQIHWHRDAHVCLDRQRGEVKLMGALLRSGNTQRSFTVRISVMTASEDLAPANAFSVDFGDVVNAFPHATDVFASPTRDVLLVAHGNKALVYNALENKVGQTLVFDGRVVMAEWVTGERVGAILAMLRP